jgi:hypothetical protein
LFDYEPFYVGKGKYTESTIHLREAKTYFTKGNQSKLNKIRKIQRYTNSDPIILKVRENLSEQESFLLEKFLIKCIGRKDLNLGPLTNLTDGGDGVSGFRHTEEMKLENSKRGKERFKDLKEVEKARNIMIEYCKEHPEYVKENKEKEIEYWGNIDNKKKHSERIKKSHQDNPQLAKDHSKKIAELYKDNPGVRQKISKKVKLLWQDQKYRSKQIASKRKSEGII